MKNEVLSNLHKKSGNELYLKSHYSEALIKYNQALCHAESDGLKSLLFGNRSAVYFEVKRYSLCLENIQLAIKHGYPQDKLVKLKAREEKCKEFLVSEPDTNKNDQKVADFFKLSYESHSKIPFIINGIELKTSDKYGNHLITNRDLKTGDIIAIEPYLTLIGWLEDSFCFEKCSFCLQHKFYSLIPCDKCCDTIYCSESCKEQHKEISHAKRCSETSSKSSNGEWIEASERVMNIALKEFGSVEEVGKLLKNPNKLTIFDVDELSPKNVVSIVCSMTQLKNRKQFYSNLYDTYAQLLALPNSEVFKDVFVQINLIVLSNSLDSYQFIGEGISVDENNTAFTLGVLGSLFNHSCDPNIARVTLDNKMVFYVRRPIKAGEKLCISYGASFTTKSLRERQMWLMDKYGFVCDCDACKNDYPLMVNLRRVNRKIPQARKSTVDQAIETFKKNCKMITKLQNDHPCYESYALNGQNTFVINDIAEIKL